MGVFEERSPDQEGMTRRTVIRKAAYAAPVVFAIAAAPDVALGSSGPKNGGSSKDRSGDRGRSRDRRRRRQRDRGRNGGDN